MKLFHFKLARFFERLHADEGVRAAIYAQEGIFDAQSGLEV